MTNQGHPALRQTPQERIAHNRERYDQLKKNARYGVPPWTVDDCRFMVWLLDGERLGERKRCEACGGSGDQESVGFIRVKGTDYPLRPDCRECNGTGYVG